MERKDKVTKYEYLHNRGYNMKISRTIRKKKTHKKLIIKKLTLITREFGFHNLIKDSFDK